MAGNSGVKRRRDFEILSDDRKSEILSVYDYFKVNLKKRIMFTEKR